MKNTAMKNNKNGKKLESIKIAETLSKDLNIKPLVEQYCNHLTTGWPKTLEAMVKAIQNNSFSSEKELDALLLCFPKTKGFDKITKSIINSGELQKDEKMKVEVLAALCCLITISKKKTPRQLFTQIFIPSFFLNQNLLGIVGTSNIHQ